MRLSHVSVAYSQYNLLSKDSDVVALRDVSLELQAGENLGILGHNGAGKSTLMRVMAGVLEPNEGWIDDEGMSCALLSLNAGFDPELSGVHNIVMHGMLNGLSRREALARVPGVTEMSGLGEAIHRRVTTYSTGMRSRLCFSTAISLDPDILLLDEVFSVGDREFREKSRKIMLERFQQDKAIVYVTHNANMVRKMCHRALWLEEGTVRAYGSAEEVAAEYREAASAAG